MWDGGLIDRTSREGEVIRYGRQRKWLNCLSLFLPHLYSLLSDLRKL